MKKIEFLLVFLLLPILDWWPLHIGHCTEANFKICFEDSALNSTRMGDYNLLPLSMFDLAFNKYHTSVKVYSPHSRGVGVSILNMVRKKYSSPDVLFKSRDLWEKRASIMIHSARHQQDIALLLVRKNVIGTPPRTSPHKSQFCWGSNNLINW